MRKRLIAAALILVILCTGCGSEIKVTQEQNDLIAEYVAGVLLKYSNDYKYKYSKLNHKLEQPTQSPTTPGQSESETSVNPKPSEGQSESATQAPSVLDTLAKALSAGLKVRYNTFVIGKEYPVGALVSMPATEGKKLFVLEFVLTNDTSDRILCNGKSSKVILKVKVNDGREYIQASTIFKNDVANMDNYAIEAGKQDIGIAVFMIPEDELKDVSKIELSLIVDNEDKGSVVIK